tara:strand:- start:345 stop:587 length:243 start_codon:yes stop_codon:yes gene_type:complete
MEHIYPYKKKVYDCWCIHDVDRRADWCREYCLKPFFVDMRYCDNPENDIHPRQDPDAYVDEVTFEFCDEKDLVLFCLVWC